MEKISQGPFFQWTKGLTGEAIQAAHDYIYTIIDEEGPFDGVMAFSQGAALAISILLQHEIDNSEQPPPFNFAIIFSSFVVVSPDKNFAQKEFESASQNNKEAVLRGFYGIKLSEAQNGSTQGDSVDAYAKAVEAVVVEYADIVGSTIRTIAGPHVRNDSDIPTELSGGLESIPRIYHPAIMTERVTVPAIHIVGRNDPFRKQSDLAIRLFAKGTKIVQHSGNHDVPKLDREIRAAVTATKLIIQRSELLPKKGWYWVG